MGKPISGQCPGQHHIRTECAQPPHLCKFVLHFVSLLGFCLGTTLGWVSPMQPLLTSPHPPVGTQPMSEGTIAWLGSINFIGSVIGTFFWGIAADRMGRKTAASLVAIPFIASWTLILAAQNTTWLIIARIVAGIGNSGATVNVPIFISEIAQDDLRGFFGSFLILFINIGVLFSYVIGTYLKYNWLAICCMTVPVIFVLTFIWVPETPMFYWKNGQTNKAEQSLLWYRGGDENETEKVLSKYKTISRNQYKKPSLKSLVATTGTTKALIIGIALMTSVQGSGIFPILNFAVSIFDMCGTSLTAYQSAIIMGTVQFIFTCFCSVLVDRLGRKVLLVGSLMMMTVSLLVLGSYLFFLANQSMNPILRGIPIVSLSLHVIAFAVGVGPVPFIIMAEIFPPEIRGLAMSQLQLITGILAFTTVKLFPIMKKLLKPQGCFWFYSFCCLVFSIFFSFYLPETKGKPQNVILKLLNKEDLTNYDTNEVTKNIKEKQSLPLVQKDNV
ncbi:hypothetical protein J6590_050826 [Homalodisca vitripennis]|nr:hypothetical protein J6590_050826 [Homalodisca vitripennis]